MSASTTVFVKLTSASLMTSGVYRNRFLHYNLRVELSLSQDREFSILGSLRHVKTIWHPTPSSDYQSQQQQQLSLSASWVLVPFTSSRPFRSVDSSVCHIPPWSPQCMLLRWEKMNMQTQRLFRSSMQTEGGSWCWALLSRSWGHSTIERAWVRWCMGYLYVCLLWS